MAGPATGTENDAPKPSDRAPKSTIPRQQLWPLVEVKIIHAHDWDMKESKPTQLYAMAKAVVTGQPPTSLGDSAEIRLRQKIPSKNPSGWC